MPNLKLPLFLTRLFIALFLAPWWIGKAVNIDLTKGLFAKYYNVDHLPDALAYAIGGLGLLLLLAFLLGFKKRISYGLIFGIHAVGTLMALPYLVPDYFDKFGIFPNTPFNILFMAALPTAAAMFLLYILRKQDLFLTIDR
ncbi:hypothetical protein [Robiginitomaculum antarcticum]|uniref:hypothetical protein n=1 Tax=Robiginitomaculum antarcticum TaxID=437507 RepID=UPI00037883FE|nr:hypothetical protein [Robiginitomaculum antarcticum]